MDDKIYSRINVLKAHVFDHSTGKVLCGARSGNQSPNKTLFDANEMLLKHSAIAERRGYPNPYKFCCKRCESKLVDM